MKELIIALMLWIGANTNYNVDWPAPQVIRMDKAPLECHYYKGEVPEHSDIHGFYDLKKKIIYIRGETNIDDPWVQGLLLHELIHYIQDMNNAKFNCTAEMEKEAWPLQQKYLKEEHDYIWDYDQLWFMVISTCGPYDPY